MTRDDYESRVEGFHAALAAEAVPGFQRSFSSAVSGVPWSNDSGESYEDWYLIDDSAALDRLNDAAVTASRQVPHDTAAAAAAGGTAGLYRLRLGGSPGAPRFAYWFAKPSGVTYQDFLAAFDRIASGSALWGRQMTLGPGPEFCLHTQHEIVLPVKALQIQMRSVWPRGEVD